MAFDNKSYQKAYYIKNKEVMRKKQKEWNKKPENIISRRLRDKKRYYSEKGREAKAVYLEKNKHIRAEKARIYYIQNKETIAEKYIERRNKRGKPLHNKLLNQQRKNRLEKLQKAMGGVCKNCLEDDPIFLQIDHVNNDGWVCRNPITGKKEGKLKLKTYLENPKKYQLLCANCNWAKHLNGGKLYKPKKKKKVA